jgi:hypothetical protein
VSDFRQDNPFYYQPQLTFNNSDANVAAMLFQQQQQQQSFQQDQRNEGEFTQ